MNYLAHAYLSFHQPPILVGNMISDFVKGRKKFDYSPGIRKGIQLHRDIDEFTDSHAATHEAKSFFRKDYRLYSAVFVDVVYDHFLANDQNEFANEDSLMQFSHETYQIMEAHFNELPERFQYMLPFMKKQNWLYNYQFRRGIQNSFGGLVRRATYLHESDTAFALFEEHYEELKSCYQSFFPHVKEYARGKLEMIMNDDSI